MLADRIPQWIREGEKRGKAMEEARGEAKMLLKLLNLKFGVLPEGVEQQVNSADIEQLNRWAELVLTAGSVEEIFS